jgi:hypothetical protein
VQFSKRSWWFFPTCWWQQISFWIKPSCKVCNTKTLYSLTSTLDKKTKYTLNVKKIFLKKYCKNIYIRILRLSLGFSSSDKCPYVRLISLRSFIILRVDASGKPFACIPAWVNSIFRWYNLYLAYWSFVNCCYMTSLLLNLRYKISKIIRQF